MANTLKMEKQILIKQLLELGWSYRRIEDETGIRRETVSKYDPKHPRYTDTSKAAKVPADSPADDIQNRPNCPPIDHVEEDADIDSTSPVKPTRVSHAAPYDSIIRDKLSLGLSAQRIYQDLVCEYEFQYSYDCIKRYVRKLNKKTPKVHARLHSLPGEEAQVDFGKGAPTLKNGRYVRPWFFKIVLSYSRHSYEEAVWTQDVETFILCHERAFEAFGGVPAIIRYDNLKSVVLQAHLFEPELNPLFVAFAEHYNFSILPCLPRKPEHKGKTESGVGYTKDNALKGLKFDSIKAHNDYLRSWNKQWARTRIHGTTKRQVWNVFINEEKSALRLLPCEIFEYFKIGKRSVHKDGHIEIKKAYYSVPHHLVGLRLDVRFNSKWIKAFYNRELVAFHRAVEPGHFQTEKKHLPEHFCLTTKEYETKLLNQCRNIGQYCQLWAINVIKQRNQLGFRAIQGILKLNQKYPGETIDSACAQAMQLGSCRYHTVKLLCDDQHDPEKQMQGQLELLQTHELIRSPAEYQAYANLLQQADLKQE